MKLYVYPYTTASESAKLLAEELDAKRIKLQNSEYEHKAGNLVINWGNGNCPHPCLNPPSALKDTINKLSFFRLLNGKGLDDALPNYWTSIYDVPDSAFPVLCRTTLEGRDGDGIVVANNRQELVNARLYTKLERESREFRVTVFKGYGVTDIQRKSVRSSFSGTAHPFIKTYANGWGFQRINNSQAPAGLAEFAIKVLDATGLDFAGLDIILTNDGKFKVLEANSAMGLEGEAVKRFADAVRWYVNKITPVPTPAPIAAPAPTLAVTGTMAGDSRIDAIKIAADKRDFGTVIRLAAQLI